MKNQTSFYNREQICEFVENETVAQPFMDTVYLHYGFDVDRTRSCKGFDCVIVSADKKLSIEEKYRNKDWGDFLIELFQCVEQPELGWFYHVTADYLNYVICSDDWTPQYFYRIHFGKFKAWFCSHLVENKKPKAIVSPKGKGLSLNIAVNWPDIPDDICNRFVIP